MGFLSNLFGKEVEKAANDFLGGILNGGSGSGSDNSSSNSYNGSNYNGNDYNGSYNSGYNSDNSYNANDNADDYDSPSGFSWGERMPDEENQYNYNGTYLQYFKDIYNSEFSDYIVELDESKGIKNPIFTFMDGQRKVLVVELLSKSSSAKKLRKDCAEEGIPYLRFYYDYHGWWNTRRYVIERTRGALT